MAVAPGTARRGLRRHRPALGRADGRGVLRASLACRSRTTPSGIGGGTAAEQLGRMLPALGRSSSDERPDAVLVYGDTNSTLAGALAAVTVGVPVAHVEAGLRSFDRRMPEETNRVLTDHVSRWLFAPTPTAVANLARRGDRDGGRPPRRRRDAGPRGPDRRRRSAIRPCSRRSPRGSGSTSRPARYLFATIHRAENRIADGDPAAGRRCWRRAASPDRPVVLALHPGTRAAVDGGRRRAPAAGRRRRAAAATRRRSRSAARGSRPDRLGRRPARGGVAAACLPRPARDDGVGRGGRRLRWLDGRRRPRPGSRPSPSSTGWRRPGPRRPGRGRARPRWTCRRPAPPSAIARGPGVAPGEGRHVRPERRDGRCPGPQGGGDAARRRPRRSRSSGPPGPTDHAGVEREERDGFTIVRVPLPRWRRWWRWLRAPSRVWSMVRRRTSGPARRADGRPRLGRDVAVRDARLGEGGGSRGGPADVYHGHDLTGLPAAVFARRANRRPARLRQPRAVHRVGARRPGGRSGPSTGSRGASRRGRPRRTRSSRSTRRSPTTSGADFGPGGSSSSTTARRGQPTRRSTVRTGSVRPPASPPDAPVVALHGRAPAGPRPGPLAEAMLEPGLEAAHLAFLGFGPLRGGARRARRGAAVRRPAPRPRSGRRRSRSSPWVASADVDAHADPGLTTGATSCRRRTSCSRRSRPACRSSRATFRGCGRSSPRTRRGRSAKLCDPTVGRLDRRPRSGGCSTCRPRTGGPVGLRAASRPRSSAGTGRRSRPGSSSCTAISRRPGERRATGRGAAAARRSCCRRAARSTRGPGGSRARWPRAATT